MIYIWREAIVDTVMMLELIKCGQGAVEKNKKNICIRGENRKL
jgi:hypothetical protein